jgi:hypothetical protein
MFRAAYGRGTPTAYYQCPHNANNPRYTASHPAHPRTVKIREDLLDQVAGAFFRDHIFGPGRAALLAAQLPATDAAAAADRDTRTAALQIRLRQIDTGLNSCVLELEQLPADPSDTAAGALRTRIRARFAELHTEHEQKKTQLAALAPVTPKAADTTLLDQLPLAGDILPSLPDTVKAALFAAVDLQILWDRTGRQATVYAEITDATLRALPALLNPGLDGYADTAAAGNDADQPRSVEDLFEPPIIHLFFR